MKAEALAELDAEDSDDDDCYITRPDNGFTPPKGFVYKNPVLCAAHVVGIADPYHKTLESVQAIHRKLEEWNVRPQSDEPGYPVMYGNHSRYNSQELNNTELKRQRDKEKKDELQDAIRAYQEDRRNFQDIHAQDRMAYERAKFQADCAARNIRTTEDAERALTRIAVARADVVSQDILDLHVTLSNVVWAAGTGGGRRQPATYGIVAQGRWSAIAVMLH